MSAAPPAPTLARDRLVRGWIGAKGISDAGDALWTVAVAWTAVHVAGPAVAGLVVAAGSAPRAVVLLLGGVVADRYDARRVMMLVGCVRIAVLLMVCGWVLGAGPSVPLLVVAAVSFGVCDAVHEPSSATIGRQLVGPEQLPAYAGATQTVSRIGTMTGAAAGGAVVAGAGLAGSAVANAVTFAVVVGYLTWRLRPRYPLARSAPEPVLRAVGRGFAHLRTEPTTRTLVLTLSGLNLAVGPALALGVALRAQQAGWGAHAVGVLEALVGLGAAAGSAVLVRRRPRREAVAGFCFLVVQGVAVALIGVGPLPLTAFACVVIGVTAGAASSLLAAVFQAVVDPEFLGRMASIQRLGDDVLMPAAMVLFGAIAGGVGVAGACAAFGFAMAGLMVVPMTRTAVRTLSLAPARDSEREPAAP